MILGEEHSAWAWDEKTGEYYLALFTPEQPDLNWESTEVRTAVHDVMRFWLDKGCCGFRMDVINHISKVQTFPDAPVVVPGHRYQPGHVYFANGPRLHEWLKELNREVLSRYDTITVGEMPFVQDEHEIIRGVGAREHELRMIFIFDMVSVDNLHWRMTLKDWTPRDIKRIVCKWQKFMIDNDGWNSVFWENHDNPRSISRYCDDGERYRELSAKMLALMATTLSGTPYVYMGQEIGMRNMPESWGVEEYKVRPAALPAATANRPQTRTSSPRTSTTRSATCTRATRPKKPRPATSCTSRRGTTRASPCSGPPASTPASPPPSPGCASTTTTAASTRPRAPPTRTQTGSPCTSSGSGASRTGRGTRRCLCMGVLRPWMRATTACSRTSGRVRRRGTGSSC